MTTTLLDAPLSPGDQLRFAEGGAPSWWWDARAVSERYAVLTHQAPFEPKGTLIYTIIDWRRGVRGPLAGHDWNFGTNPDIDAARLLEALESSTVVDGRALRVEVSYRNNVPVGVLDRRRTTSLDEQTTERRSTGECSSCGAQMDLVSEDFWECGNGHPVDESIGSSTTAKGSPVETDDETRQPVVPPSRIPVEYFVPADPMDELQCDSCQ